jgi:hypothetical protein
MPDEDFQQEVPEPQPRRVARPPREDRDDDVRIRQPDIVETFIPYKNPLGLIAYYLGVFAFIPCVGLLLGPAALILGILGIRYRNKHPTAGGLGHAITGVVLGSLTTLGYWGIVAVSIVLAVYK